MYVFLKSSHSSDYCLKFESGESLNFIKKNPTQVVAWYKEERFSDPNSLKQLESVSEHIYKSFELLKNGRSIGTIGLKKILSNISPLRLTNKINPCMALLLSMILTSIDDMGQKNMKLDSACLNLQTHVEKAIKHIRFGKKLDRILMKISNEVQVQLDLWYVYLWYVY